MRFFSLVFTALLLVQSASMVAQSDLATRFDSLSLKEQFDYVYSKSETYERYKVIKISTYNLLKSSSIDSVAFYRNDLVDRNEEIDLLKGTVEGKDAQINSLTNQLQTLTNSKNSMMFLGIEVSKVAYNSIMWGLVFALVVLVLVLFMLFKRSHTVTNETKLRLSEVEEEFETHRKSALKREQKLARELMDEKLKHKF
ncbi:hypothetical protein [Carboxylicivirga taeanensis]|uniref:hypothetical protein n=1 Tax=Carboxylicivirga taeanensis TaxID=1416875 RepID=UPI003F6E3CC0